MSASPSTIVDPDLVRAIAKEVEGTMAATMAKAMESFQTQLLAMARLQHNHQQLIPPPPASYIVPTQPPARNISAAAATSTSTRRISDSERASSAAGRGVPVVAVARRPFVSTASTTRPAATFSTDPTSVYRSLDTEFQRSGSLISTSSAGSSSKSLPLQGSRLHLANSSASTKELFHPPSNQLKRTYSQASHATSEDALPVFQDAVRKSAKSIARSAGETEQSEMRTYVRWYLRMHCTADQLNLKPLTKKEQRRQEQIPASVKVLGQQRRESIMAGDMWDFKAGFKTSVQNTVGYCGADQREHRTSNR